LRQNIEDDKIHHMGIYTTSASGNSKDVELNLSSPGKESLAVTPPPEFKGPDGFWTPEDLFSASISSCFILTFKSLARFKKMEWESIEVKVEAKLEKTENGLKFTDVIIYPRLTICCSSDIDPYLELLEKTKTDCLVTKSMNCNFSVSPKVIVQAVKRSTT
jgi:organic hydroperoxide reductase OsmC/OhrA